MGSSGSKKSSSSSSSAVSSAADHHHHHPGHRDDAATKQHLNPTGLYPTCNWDLKTIRKLIIEKKLAPFFPGREEKDSPELDECPICFLYYGGGLNRTKCCQKGVCTECFLQIKKPGAPLADSVCPFCNRSRFTVVFLGPKTREERMKEEQEEQKVLELQERMRQEEIERDLQREREKQKEKDQDMSKDGGKRDTQESSGTMSIKGSGGNVVVGRESARSASRAGSSSEIPSRSDPPAQSSSSGSSPEQDLEDLMLMEAIRLSLMDSKNQTADAHREERSSSSSPDDSDDDRVENYCWINDDVDIDIDLSAGKRRVRSRSGSQADDVVLNNRSRRSSSSSSVKAKEKGEESDKEDDDDLKRQHQVDCLHKCKERSSGSGYLFGQIEVDEDDSLLLVRKRGESAARSSSSTS